MTRSNWITSSRVPDRLKTARYWQVQMDIAKANDKGDDLLEIQMLDESQDLLFQFLEEAA